MASPVDARLDAVDADQLTPLEALALVQELKELRQRDPG